MVIKLWYKTLLCFILFMNFRHYLPAFLGWIARQKPQALALSRALVEELEEQKFKTYEEVLNSELSLFEKEQAINGIFRAKWHWDHDTYDLHKPAYYAALNQLYTPHMNFDIMDASETFKTAHQVITSKTWNVSQYRIAQLQILALCLFLQSQRKWVSVNDLLKEKSVAERTIHDTFWGRFLEVLKTDDANFVISMYGGEWSVRVAWSQEKGKLMIVEWLYGLDQSVVDTLEEKWFAISPKFRKA